MAVIAAAVVAVVAAVIAGSLSITSRGALGRGAPFFCPKYDRPLMIRGLPMEQVSFEELRLLDLHGNAVDLREHFRQYLLLIFLRHLA